MDQHEALEGYYLLQQKEMLIRYIKIKIKHFHINCNKKLWLFFIQLNYIDRTDDQGSEKQ